MSRMLVILLLGFFVLPAFASKDWETQEETDRRRLEERIPITGGDLPKFNAILNSSCAVLLVLGYILIRLRYETLHKITMLLALAVSMVFLSSYIFYHFAVMEMEPTRFRG